MTTLAVVLATAAAGLLVEADLDGGVLGARYGCWLHDDAPSLPTMVATLRPGIGPAAVLDHTQKLPAGTRVVVAGAAAEDVIGPVEALSQNLVLLRQVLADERVVFDVGRLRPDGPGLDLATAADARVVVTRPTTEALACLLARLPILVGQPALRSRLIVVVHGEGPYRLGEIAAEVRARIGPTPVLSIPDDPRAVDALTRAGERESRRLERSALMRATRQLAELLDAVTEPGHESDDLGTEPEPGSADSFGRQTAGEGVRR